MSSAPPGRTLPHSLEAEEYVLSSCLLDGEDIIPKALSSGCTPDSFYDAKHGLIFGALRELHSRGKSADVGVLAQHLKESGDLDKAGGLPFLIEISGRAPTTAQASYFIETVRSMELRRGIIRQGTGLIEECYTNRTLDELQAQLAEFASSSLGVGKVAPPKGIMDFAVPKPGDKSILLGNRYLNRGDGGVLVSTSGMGKSSMTIQCAILWALGRAAFGIRPNGPLKSLVIQAEDSEGDIGEVQAGVCSGLDLKTDEMKAANDRVLVVTERTRRGARFVAHLRGLVARHKPDLVWINPLQAFMDGDVTESADLGRFLREGLNGMNEPASFGFIVVHHTTKPATGREKAERQWHEVMYDMAGGAEIINWARFIMSLRAMPTFGEFKLVLAKRGRRAGVTRKVEQGAGFRDEIVTEIGLRHSKGQCEADGLTIPKIFWEEMDLPESEKTAPTEPAAAAQRTGRHQVFPFDVFRKIFPGPTEKPIRMAQLIRLASELPTPSGEKITQRTLSRRIFEAVQEGYVVEAGGAYRLAPPTSPYQKRQNEAASDPVPADTDGSDVSF